MAYFTINCFIRRNTLRYWRPIVTPYRVIAGTSTISVNVTDSLGDTGVATASLVIAPAPVVLPTCQGSAAIVSSTTSSKVFMTLANGQKLAYSNTYGSQGTTQFTYNGGIAFGTFPIGAIATYAGILDASTICLPNTLTIDPAPVVQPPVCTAPTGAKVEGKAKITAVSTNSITVGGTVVYFDNCTVKEMNGGAKAFALGQTAEYKAMKSNGKLLATKITIN